MRALAIALLAVAATGAAGCGTDDETARRVTTDFIEAVQSGDGDTACAQLNPQTRARLEREEQRECREAVTELKLEPGSITGVEIYVTNAVVTLSSGESEFLEEGDQGWRLAAVGCQPAKDKPADQPYDCQLED